MTTSQLQPIHFLSYSSRLTLASCPKKLQLDKHGEEKVDTSSVTFAFGHAIGAGVQSLLSGKEWNQVLLDMFFAWDVDLLGTEEKSKKSFALAVYAVDKFQAYASAIRSDWELATFNGKPAVELSFRLDLQNGFVYRAYIDVVLKNKTTGELLVVEIKTTSLTNLHEETYGNSDQALSYSLVLDKIAEGNSSYHVWYLVYKSKEMEWETFPFTKSILDKAKWIKSITLDCRTLAMYIEEDFFPMRGQSCLDFFRPCVYYGMCGLSNKALLASKRVLDERVEKELKEEYTFCFTLEEIINQQLERV